MKKLAGFWLLALVAVLGVSTPGHAESLRGRYYMVVFGYQGPGNRAVDSHTFASFYRGEDLDRGNTYNPATISWLPASGVVRPLGRETGRNFSLEETLDIARRTNAQVAAYGPYEISQDLFYRGMDRIRFLESGQILYRMINGVFASRGVNCIAAVGDIGGQINTGTQWGFSASASVVSHLSRWIYAYPQMNYDVARRIDLNRMIGR